MGIMSTGKGMSLLKGNSGKLLDSLELSPLCWELIWFTLTLPIPAQMHIPF